LDSIEDRLARSDPKLASLLAAFTQLTAGEEIPVREKIRTGQRRAARRQPLSYQRAMLLLWLVVSVALAAAGLVVSRSADSRRACMGLLSIACAGQVPAHAARPAARTSGWPGTAVEVGVPQRGEPGDIVVPDCAARLAGAGDGSVEVTVFHSTTALRTRPSAPGWSYPK